MRNLTTKKLNDLKELLKGYDGAIDKWVKLCKVSQQTFGTYFHDTALTNKKKEVYGLGLKLLKDLKEQEADEIEELERPYASVLQ
jgi:hypothetical protein